MRVNLSDIAGEVDHAAWLVGGVCVLLFVGIVAALILLSVRYRRSRSRVTSQVEGHKWLEITWTVLPTLLVVWMFFVGYKGFAMMRSAPADAMAIEVTARRWSWSFRYSEQGIDSSELWVPVGTPVKVTISSPADDVLHSLYIPDLRIKEDAVPGRKSYLWFRAERAGTFDIFCAEYCGKDHSQMLSVLHVISPTEFAAWVESTRAKRYRPLVFEGLTDPNHPAFGKDQLNIDGDRLFKTYCASCHGQTGDGSGLPGLARNFIVATGWKRSPKVTDIYRTLMEGVPSSQMRPFPALTPWEKVALAHRVRKFLATPPPADTTDDFAALVKDYALDKTTGPRKTIPVEKAMDALLREAAATAAPIAPGP